MKNEIRNELNLQINREMQSAYNYLGIATWCSEKGYPGSAHWFSLQAKEEMEHALKIYKYLLDRGETPTLESVGKPKAAFEDLRSTFEAALEQEREVENFLNAISVKAAEAKDHVTLNFLAWFLEEQVEEVASVQTILDQLSLAKDSLFLVDQELGKRTETESAGN